MPAPAVLKFDASDVAPDVSLVATEKLLAGNPRQSLWLHYTDPTRQFSAGVWRSEPGKWLISYTEEEYCHLIEGVSVITDAEGRATTVTAGESFVIPRGFNGTWEVVETTTKRFVVYEAGG